MTMPFIESYLFALECSSLAVSAYQDRSYLIRENDLGLSLLVVNLLLAVGLLGN